MLFVEGCSLSLLIVNLFIYYDLDRELSHLHFLFIINILAKISHCLCICRLPWVAPELFKDMSKMTISGDVYAFSTTLWECATLGRSPLEVQPLKDFNLDSDKVRTLKENR